MREITFTYKEVIVIKFLLERAIVSCLLAKSQKEKGVPNLLHPLTEKEASKLSEKLHKLINECHETQAQSSD